MKIISGFNPQAKNSSLSFEGYKSLVARESYREYNNFIGLALKLTGKDLKNFQKILKTFPNEKLDKDILSINVQGFNGNFDSPFGICINHHDIIYESKENNKVFAESLGKITNLLARVYGDEKVNTPINKSPEEEKMMKALLGDCGYTFDEEEKSSGRWKNTINSVAESLRYIIEETNSY